MNSNKKEYTNICIKEMTELMHVRGVGAKLAPLVREWLKSTGKEEIEKYDKLLNTYYKELYENAPKKGQTLYWFELLECGSQNWEVISMSPGDMALKRFYEILPRDIIEEMAEGLVDPHTVVKRPNLRSALLKKKLDLEYVHLTKTCMVGTVREHKQILKHWKDDPETAFQVYFNCKTMYTDKVLPFVEDFLHRLESNRLPAIKRLLETADAEYREKFRPRPQKWEPAPPDNNGGPVIVELEPELWGGIDMGVLFRLAKVPEFNKWLWLKLEELSSGALKKEIDAYKTTKAYYRETLLSDRNEEDWAAKGKRPSYWFMISVYEPDHWKVTEFDPLPPVFEMPEDILARGYCDMMLRSQDDPACVQTVTSDFTLPFNRRFELQWVRYSATCLMGKVFETESDGVPVPGAFYYTPDYLTLLDAAAVFRRLTLHMYRDPAVAVAFMDEFTKKLLPKLQ